MRETILNFVSLNAEPKVLRKGKSIFESKSYLLKKLDTASQTALYDVESDTYYNKKYKVTISDYLDPDSIAVSCTCPASEFQIVCKHGVAALLDLAIKITTPVNGDKNTAKGLSAKGQQTLNMSKIDENVIKRYITKEDWTKVRQLAYAERAKITTDFNQTAQATVTFKSETNDVVIQKVSSNQFVTSCNCMDAGHTLCLHRAVVFMQLYFTQGANAFELMKDWTEYKNSLLAEYGFSLNDDLTGKFNFTFENDKPQLKLLDTSLIKFTDLPVLAKHESNLSPHLKLITVPISDSKKRKKVTAKEVDLPEPDKYGIGYLFLLNNPSNVIPYFTVLPITGKLNADGTKMVSHINSVFNYSGNLEFKNIPVLDEKDLQLIHLCKELSVSSISEFARAKLKVRSRFYWGYNGQGFAESDLTPEQNDTLWKHIQKRVEELIGLLEGKEVFKQITANTHISNQTIEAVTLISEKATLAFTVKEKDDFIELQAFLKVGHDVIPIKDAQIFANLFLYNHYKIMLIENHNQPDIFKTFIEKPIIKVKKQAYPSLFSNVISPLQNHFEVQNNMEDFIIADKHASPKAQIYLKEDEDYLILQPIVDYEGSQVELDENPTTIFANETETIRLHRDVEFEAQLKDLILHLHPNFLEQFLDTNGLYFYINYDEVMIDGWLLNVFEELKSKDIEVFGFKSLSKFHFNLNKPKLTFSISSGIDWFDVHAEVEFGDLSVSLKDVQKAIVKKDNFVKLSDGTLGLLPEEWLKRYATIFKMGEIKGKNNLQISKFHFSIVDGLYDEIDQESILEELRIKKEKLKNFSSIQTIPIPAEISAELRPYQKAGFNWLNFLHEFKWGGCLADDMGLGKTLQVLTFLQHLKSIDPHATNLVVVPTSLIFNWEAEVEKFCPDLSILRYHGPDRFKIEVVDFAAYDIVLTTYGTLASDITEFTNFTFNYLILDESQAIKNPETKRYKAVRLLKAYNRIAMTGTPIENNTFDLYAQLNFLNPGMLGSIEFFKEQYSNPIDKHSDPERVDELKRIVFPFILRRTKEVVAQDLPEKTETILFCQMGSKQRKVYDAFKDNYRYKILDKINNEGMSRAGIYILEGLMKLRQICDSPELLKDPEDYGTESVKLEELMEHITEHTGKHKILIFSQFLGMLSLIKKRLEKHEIGYTLLTGATSPAGREEAVRLFQTDENCRVFLVSLKAGGTGLNLTAADYVFLVDPWWNPAVEQQAIDRTHRIGQVNHVFAYKMICKDTVEEKILSLQQKKKTLAADLISTDKSFIKSLTKSDVVYLFS